MYTTMGVGVGWTTGTGVKTGGAEGITVGTRVGVSSTIGVGNGVGGTGVAWTWTNVGEGGTRVGRRSCKVSRKAAEIVSAMAPMATRALRIGHQSGEPGFWPSGRGVPAIIVFNLAPSQLSLNSNPGAVLPLLTMDHQSPG